MRRLLSSRMTFFHKIVFPTVWIGGFSFGTLAMWLRALHGGGQPDPDIDQMKWIFLLLTVIGVVFNYWCGIRFKKVEIDEVGFQVSNYLKTVTVPVSDIEDVSGSILMNPEMVWLKFRRKTEFGSTIVFMPPYRVFGGFNEHPLVGQLRKLIQKDGETNSPDSAPPHGSPP